MPITFQQSLEEVERLVKYFQTNQPVFLAGAYKGAQARNDLINPLFGALGWDVTNAEHAAQDHQCLLMEESRRSKEGQQCSPDYTFRTSKDHRLFFVEAKKPGVALKANASAAYQLRSCGWNAKLP